MGCGAKVSNEGGSMKHHSNSLNRLSRETSPYLLQHAGNPVDWYPWGEEALEKARKEDKPIFLSIGYSACHWCHVMAHESFENEEIARILNEDFVPIKVDREERPDLDSIYMSAVQMMTGQGGWPLSVFLTPDLEPFFGGTYFPPEDKYGRPGFKSVLHHISGLWQKKDPAVFASAKDLTRNLQRMANATDRKPSLVDTNLLAGAMDSLAESYDKEWGGFGNAPKFPPSGSLQILLRHAARTGDGAALAMALTTLKKMAHGGMYDQVGGGFHRYSVDRVWLVPHFEKMLYDNAALSQAYLTAWQLTRDPFYRRIANETLQYVMRDLRDKNGAFYSAQDADSEGVEGKYYVWSLDEIQPLLAADTEKFSTYYGVTERGNFEEDNILFVPDYKNEELYSELSASRARLLVHRYDRIPPLTDTKILASWNGMMISAFARAAQVLDSAEYLQVATQAATFVVNNMIADDQLYHVYSEGKRYVPGFLDDYAQMMNALIDLYEASFDVSWLKQADLLAQGLLERFGDSRGGALFQAAPHQSDLLVREKPLYDGAVPSGNSVAALALLRLSVLLERPAYRKQAEQILFAASAQIKRSPRGFMNMLDAVDFYLYPPREFAIVGDPASNATKAFLQVIRGRMPGNSVVALKYVDEDAEQAAYAQMPLLKDKELIDGQPVVYVCENFACLEPATDVAALKRILNIHE